MRFLSLIRSAPVVALVALAAGGLGGCISTATYGTGEAPEGTLLREATGGLMSMLNGEEKPQIAYEPRAPLVIPPAAQLPEPAPPPSQLAADGWPDETGAAEDPQTVGANSQTRAMSPDYVRRLRPLTGVMQQAEQRERRRYERDPARAFLADQNQSGREFQAALAEAEGLNSTERRYLTDPPSEYRQPAESAPTEFEDIERKKSGNFFSRLFGG